VKSKLVADVEEAVQVTTVRGRLLGLGAAPIGSSSEEFEALIRAESERWGPVIRVDSVIPAFAG
jgi:tripartite-type tricarboxylate transporter receptor subunit TctC